jgi:hypothetical protein
MSPYQYICSPSNSVTSLNTYLCVMTFLVDTHMLPLKKSHKRINTSDMCPEDQININYITCFIYMGCPMPYHHLGRGVLGPS